MYYKFIFYFINGHQFLVRRNQSSKLWSSQCLLLIQIEFIFSKNWQAWRKTNLFLVWSAIWQFRCFSKVYLFCFSQNNSESIISQDIYVFCFSVKVSFLNIRYQHSFWILLHSKRELERVFYSSILHLKQLISWITTI